MRLQPEKRVIHSWTSLLARWRTPQTTHTFMDVNEWKHEWCHAAIYGRSTLTSRIRSLPFNSPASIQRANDIEQFHKRWKGRHCGLSINGRTSTAMASLRKSTLGRINIVHDNTKPPTASPPVSPLVAAQRISLAAQANVSHIPSATSSSIAPFTWEKHHWKSFPPATPAKRTQR